MAGGFRLGGGEDGLVRVRIERGDPCVPPCLDPLGEVEGQIVEVIEDAAVIGIDQRIMIDAGHQPDPRGMPQGRGVVRAPVIVIEFGVATAEAAAFRPVEAVQEVSGKGNQREEYRHSRRRLVERHRGILPLDTVESIWRVIIATFTYVQAPFSVHADLSAGESAMRDSARFHFGFTVPFVSHFDPSAAVEAVARSKGDLALLSATANRTPWWLELEAEGAPKIIARLPFIERADHPAALPVFVVSRVADSAMVTEVEMWSVRVAGWNAEIARALSPLAETIAVSDSAFDGAALLVSVSTAATSLDKVTSALVAAGASVRSTALVGSHATRYTVPDARPKSGAS